MDLKSKVRNIPDWPKPGVNFKDITPLLQDAASFRQMIDELATPYQGKKIDVVVAIDARGFLLATAVAYKLGAGVALVRKKGKLPYKTISESYDLEYGSNVVEMHEDAVVPGQKVLIVDDVLATGGTMAAAVKMVQKLGGEIIGISFLIGLSFLNGKEKLKGYEVKELLVY
ncbi:MAG: adenine phosphoribosyltransferase [Patescibacteria group bacterium]